MKNIISVAKIYKLSPNYKISLKDLSTAERKELVKFANKESSKIYAGTSHGTSIISRKINRLSGTNPKRIHFTW